MGYLFLSFALLAGVTKGYCGKKTSGFMRSFSDASFASFIRMIFCAAFGLLIVLLSGDAGQLVPSINMLLVSMLSGVASAFFVLTWLVEVRKSAYMLVDIFLMMGVVLTLVLSKIFFSEAIKLTQWLGVAVLAVAVLIMCSYNNTIKAKLTLSSLITLIACGVSFGVTDFSQKLFVKVLPGASAAVFNFYTYIFSGITLILVYAFSRKVKNMEKAKFPKEIVGYILIMAVCLFLNSFFKTLAANHLDAVLLYPLNQGASLILSSVMCAIVFKEKITLKAAVGIVIAFLGLVIINLI